MGAKVRSGGRFYVDGHSGEPANGWKVYTYEAGSAGVLGSDDKNCFTDNTLGTAHANPVVLDSRGEAEIWFNGVYLIKVYDADDNLIYSLDYFGQGEDASVDAYVSPLNGSFEIDDNGDDIPDNWTLAAGANGTIVIDDTDAIYGLKSLEFTGTDATGGGTATSDKFAVLAGTELDVLYAYKSSAANTLNKLEVKFYDISDAFISTETVLSEGSSNPTSWTDYYDVIDVPSNAVRAEVVITGVDGAGTTVAGSTNFDDIVCKKHEYRRVEMPVQTPGSVQNLDFEGIPPWVKKIEIEFLEVSADQIVNMGLQLGTASGLDTTGNYQWTLEFEVNLGTPNVSGSNTFTSFRYCYMQTAGAQFNGRLVLTKFTGNTWMFASVFGSWSGAVMCNASGKKALSAALDRVRVFTETPGVYDNGSVKVVYEG